MLNQRTEIINNVGTGTNMPFQVTIAWIETDVKLKFLEIIEIFEACGSLDLL